MCLFSIFTLLFPERSLSPSAGCDLKLPLSLPDRGQPEGEAFSPVCTLLTQTGLLSFLRSWAERVCRCDVTGRWSGRLALCLQRWRTKTSAECQMTHTLETTTSPRVWSAQQMVSCSVAIMWRRHSCRIGVYLDYKAGILCFYHVPDPMVLLHKVQTTFVQPLNHG